MLLTVAPPPPPPPRALIKLIVPPQSNSFCRPAKGPAFLVQHERGLLLSKVGKPYTGSEKTTSLCTQFLFLFLNCTSELVGLTRSCDGGSLQGAVVIGRGKWVTGDLLNFAINKTGVCVHRIEMCIELNLLTRF